MASKQTGRALLAGLGVSLAVAGAADAQSYNRGRNVGVLERQRPDYSAIGIHAGAFTVYPRLQASAGWSDNILASRSNKQSAAFYTLQPSLDVNSDWGRHEAALSIGANLKRVPDFTTENEDGYYLKARGRLDIHGQSYATLQADAQKLYEGRYSTGFQLLAPKPLPYKSYGANARVVGDFARSRLSAGVDYRKLTYDNLSGVDPATNLPFVIDLSGRDRETVMADVKGEYAISPDTAFFVQVKGTETTYDHNVVPTVVGVPTPPKRDSTQVQVLGGANFDLTALVRGEIGAGYIRREYDAAVFGTVSGATLDAKVEYFPSDLLTLSAQAHRNIEDSVYVDPNNPANNKSGGYIATGGYVRADYELRRNILLMAQANYDESDFRGISRTDKISSLQVGATYLMNHGLGVNANIQRNERTTSGSNPSNLPDFDEMRASVGVVLQR